MTAEKSTARFDILGIDRVRFAVSQWEQACRFASDWGLAEQAAPGPQAKLFRSVDGSEIEVVQAEPGVPGRQAVGGESGVCEITWGVGGQSTLDALAQELSRDREVHVDDEGTLHTVDDLGMGIAFRLARRHNVPYEPTRYNAPGHAQRIDRRAARYESARPHEISHIAIGVDDAGAAARFYEERLGFRVSDRYANRGVFLRCSPTGNHHHLFLMNGKAPGTRFNHLAFKVRDIHEVILGGQHLDARGWKTFAGPGRHLVSSACFWYFVSPFGGAWEYAADEDVVTEAWQANDFSASAHIFSEWTFGLEKSDGRLRGPIAQSRESNAA